VFDSGIDTLIAQLEERRMGDILLGDNSSEISDMSSVSSKDADRPVFELHLPTPADTPRNLIYAHHLATRNLIAMVSGCPIVGKDLGLALIELTARLVAETGMIDESVATVLRYASSQGYASCANKPDFALAMLSLSDYYDIESVRLNAFVHCVGMSRRIQSCPAILVSLEPISVQLEGFANSDIDT
jgi:hypothetical protein